MMQDKRVALVTGSSSGIGAAVAKKLSRSGLRVVVNSTRSVAAGRAIASSLEDAIYIQSDVSHADQAQSLIRATVESFGRLDVLVNNAGTTRSIPHSDLEQATPDIWREIFDLNVIGSWQVTVAAIPHLRAHGDGSVLNISSIAGSRPTGSSIPYAVSKAALNHMTRLLAGTLGPEIRVNALAPGLIDTAWTKDFTGPREWVSTMTPLQRVGTPEDIAETAWGLLNAPYTTGEVLLADSGTHLR